MQVKIKLALELPNRLAVFANVVCGLLVYSTVPTSQDF